MSTRSEIKPVIKDRLTVVEQIYHRPHDGEPTLIERRFSRELDTYEQVYKRQRVATEEWQLLDCGWIERAGMVIVHNEEGARTQAIPTDLEKQEMVGRVIEVGYSSDKGTWLILPGESFRGYPDAVENLLIRCQRGSARYTIHVLPR